jgi:glyoxylase-like metal-dependent hydrolase (beta-lactamase superfamily II)
MSGRGSSHEHARADDGELLNARDIERVRAANPSVMTLSGTNSYLVGRDPAWLIDPGPALASHLQGLHAAIEQRGGLGGILLTHDHADHFGGVEEIAARHSAPLAAAREGADVELADGARFGPLEALATPGHSPDHFAFVGAGACFSGDAVVGEGSVFISDYRGALSSYLRALQRLLARSDFQILCPGHGDLVRDPRAKIEEYLAHRRERERRLRSALEQGRRTTSELLDAAWSEVPAQLRPAAARTLAAHLDKLEEDGVLPDGVERAATV